MDIQTVTQQVTVLRLTDDEVEHFIAHPNELAMELIRSGNSQAGVVTPAAERKNGTRKTGKRRGKKSVSAGVTFLCKQCKRGFKNEHGLHTHQAKAHGGGEIEIGAFQNGGG